jgi:beta-lactamase regulating signal transducer with metallopeptidase domain
MGLDLFPAAMQPDLIIRSTLLIGAIWLLRFALGNSAASAATRHRMWLCGMVGLLLLPVLSAFLPELPVPLLRSEGETATAMGKLAASGAAPDQAPAWAAGLGLLYLGVAAALLARMVHARWALARLWSAGETVESGWEEILPTNGAGLRRRRVSLRLSDSVAVPITWGTFSPKVLLPAAARQWPSERRDLVLMHELAHVERRDTLTQSAASLACALYWFNPAVWLAAREMRVEQEQSADDLVLGAGVKPRAYANCLLEVASGVGRHGPAVHAAATAGASQLERRLVAIIGPGNRRDKRTYSALLGAALLISIWFVSTAVPVAAVGSAEAMQPDVPIKDDRSYTAIGSAPAEAAGPGERRERMPAADHSRRRGAEPAPASSGTAPLPTGTLRAPQDAGERSPALVQHNSQQARPPLTATGMVVPSRAGLSAPPGQALSPSGVSRPPRAGEGPLPPLAGSPP